MDKPSIIMSLIDYHLMVKVKAEMDQFKDGLAALGFLNLLVSTPKEFECYFLATDLQKVTAGYRLLYDDITFVNFLLLESIKTFLIPEFSDVANLREAEEETYSYFADFLQECEGRYYLCMYCTAKAVALPVDMY